MLAQPVQDVRLDPAGGHAQAPCGVGSGELLAAQDVLVQGGAHRHALDHGLGQRAAGAANRLVAAGTRDHDLGKHRVEDRGDDVALRDAGVDPDTRACRPAQAGDRAGGRSQALCGVLAGDAQLQAVASGLRHRRQITAGSHQELEVDQVDAGHLLAHAVLDLETGVDLQEVQLVLAGQEELTGSHPHVADAVQQAAGVLDQALVQAGGQEGCWGLLQELLIASLQCAVAGRDDGEGAPGIPHALGLDVPCGGDEALQDQGGPA